MNAQEDSCGVDVDDLLERKPRVTAIWADGIQEGLDQNRVLSQRRPN